MNFSSFKKYFHAESAPTQALSAHPKIDSYPVLRKFAGEDLYLARLGAAGVAILCSLDYFAENIGGEFVASDGVLAYNTGIAKGMIGEVRMLLGQSNRLSFRRMPDGAYRYTVPPTPVADSNPNDRTTGAGPQLVGSESERHGSL